jgi:hypothetical protein
MSSKRADGAKPTCADCVTGELTKKYQTEDDNSELSSVPGHNPKFDKPYDPKHPEKSGRGGAPNSITIDDRLDRAKQDKLKESRMATLTVKLLEAIRAKDWHTANQLFERSMSARMASRVNDIKTRVFSEDTTKCELCGSTKNVRVLEDGTAICKACDVDECYGTKKDIKEAATAPAAKKAAPAKGSNSTETGGSPTSSETSTETTANPKHNVTVTGGAGDGDTIVTINLPKTIKEDKSHSTCCDDTIINGKCSGCGKSVVKEDDSPYGSGTGYGKRDPSDMKTEDDDDVEAGDVTEFNDTPGKDDGFNKGLWKEGDDDDASYEEGTCEACGEPLGNSGDPDFCADCLKAMTDKK